MFNVFAFHVNQEQRADYWKLEGGNGRGYKGEQIQKASLFKKISIQNDMMIVWKQIC